MRSSSMASTAGSSSRAAAAVVRRSTAVVPMALFSRKSSTAVVDAPAKGRKGSSKSSKSSEKPLVIKKQSFLEAFDFSAARSEDDAILIAKARGMRKGQKMSPEQYQALRRKVGGTAKDYWKGWVDVKGNYVDKGYVSDEDDAVSAPPGILFLVLTLVGLGAATAAVVSKVG